MLHYLLFYEKAADHATREPAFQAAHLNHVRAAVERGELLLGGPLVEPADGANVLLFGGESAAVAEEFAAADPYVTSGIVCKWRVRGWQTVVGEGAVCPLPGK
jgi:uncharacterized protein YciI